MFTPTMFTRRRSLLCALGTSARRLKLCFWWIWFAQGLLTTRGLPSRTSDRLACQTVFCCGHVGVITLCRLHPNPLASRACRSIHSAHCSTKHVLPKIFRGSSCWVFPLLRETSPLAHKIWTRVWAKACMSLPCAFEEIAPFASPPRYYKKKSTRRASKQYIIKRSKN